MNSRKKQFGNSSLQTRNCWVKAPRCPCASLILAPRGDAAGSARELMATHSGTCQNLYGFTPFWAASPWGCCLDRSSWSSLFTRSLFQGILFLLGSLKKRSFSVDCSYKYHFLQQNIYIAHRFVELRATDLKNRFPALTSPNA